MKKLIILFILALAVCCMGCTRQGVTNLHNMVYGEPLLSQVEECIINGAQNVGWHIERVKPGLFDIAYLLGYADESYDDPVVAVYAEITYTNKEYHIYYKKSVNMQHTQSLYTIHGAYNTWVRELDASIQKELAAAELDARAVRGVYQLMEYDVNFN